MSNIILILTQVLQLLVLLTSSGLIISSASPSSPLSSSPLIHRNLHPVLILDKTDLEYSDTSNGEVTNSDQQVVYINHGGGAVSSIRRSFAIPFSPHVSSYPTSLFDNQDDTPPSHPSSLTSSSLTTQDVGFSRRDGTPEEKTFDDPSFDDPRSEIDSEFVEPGLDQNNMKNHRMDEYVDPSPTPLRRDSLFQAEPVTTTNPPPPPPPLGLPVPPTNYGLRTNTHMTGDLVRLTEPERNSNNNNGGDGRRSFATMTSENRQNANSNNNHKSDDNPNTNNNNPFFNSLAPLTNNFNQGFSPDFFGLFESPFSPLAGLPPSNPSSNTANQDNLFQRRRLAIQNVVPDIVHNNIGSPNGYNYFSSPGGRDREDEVIKYPKIFRFTDGRINLDSFEKEKKVGKIKFLKKEPVFDNVRRDSFLILHGGTYS